MGHSTNDEVGSGSIEPVLPPDEAPILELEPGESQAEAQVRVASWTTAKLEHSLFSLLELSNELTVALDLYQVADVALFNIMGHFATSRVALWVLPDEPVQSIVLVRNHGVPTQVARGMGAELTRWLLEARDGIPDPILISRVDSGEMTAGLTLAKQCGIELIAPVPARGKVFGLIALGHRVSGEGYRTRDLELLNASLSLLGVSIENTKLYNRMVENNRQLRRANAQLQELDELKSQFLRNTNHELRTPLTIMIAYLEGLVGSEEEGSERSTHLEVIQEQSKKLEGILTNLLDFSELEGGRFQVQTAPGDVRDSLRTYFEDRRPGITAGLRELRLSVPAALPMASFDPEQLPRILDCLVDNAVKFTPQGTRIRLGAETEEYDGVEWLRVDVEDNGPGIPSERLPRIFTSFSQVDGSTTREIGGIGVGLSLARRLAERMGARLDVASTIGKGTTFSLRLPLHG